MMRTTIALTVVALLGACGDNNSNNGDMGNGDMAQQPQPDLASSFPAPPTLGAQIDRLGRPGINTALTDPFWDTTGDHTTGLAAHKAKQDAYNQNADPTTWAAMYAATFKGNLAIYDALDQDLATPGTSCGNQAGYGALGMPDYTVLGGLVLPDDELYVDTSTATCNQYLGVELKALGVNITDCGGRSPLYPVIDVTYAAVASASIALMSTLPDLDGVPADADGSPNATTFPFLGSPN